MRSTANRGGLLDIKLRPERRNTVRVLLFLDVGGSMDDHVRVCEELFSAARAEFKHLEYYYFHNFLYESLWKDNRRRHGERIPTWEVMHTYGRDHKLIFVGDATMSPYEIVYPGGSVEHWNEEAGMVWMGRLLASFRNAIWLNPEPVNRWAYTPSIELTQKLFEQRMFPLTLDGLDRGMRELQTDPLGRSPRGSPQLRIPGKPVFLCTASAACELHRDPGDAHRARLVTTGSVGRTRRRHGSTQTRGLEP